MGTKNEPARCRGGHVDMCGDGGILERDKLATARQRDRVFEWAVPASIRLHAAA